MTTDPDTPNRRSAIALPMKGDAADFVIGTDVFDALPDGVIVINRDQTIVRANRAITEMFGWSFEDLIGSDLDMLIPERFHASHADHIERFLASEQRALEMTGRAELCGLRRDGTELFVEGTILKQQVGEVVYLAVILRDVSIRKLAERQLQLALSESTASSRVKSNFLATMSHELRTPLNAIIGFSELIEREMFGPLGDPRYREYIRDIQSSGRHLLDVVTSVLKAAKLEADQIELQPEWISLRKLVTGASRQVWPIIEERGQVIDVEIDGAVEVCVDPLLSRQILINLLANAAKFSPDDSTIRVRFRDLGSRFAIDVIDRGCGIPKGALAKLGRPFVQAKTGQEISGGMGLGLYIARSYLDLHAAALSISSEVGEGSTMRTCWPASRLRLAGCPREDSADALASCRDCLQSDPTQRCTRAVLGGKSGAVRRTGRRVESLP